MQVNFLRYRSSSALVNVGVHGLGLVGQSRGHRDDHASALVSTFDDAVCVRDPIHRNDGVDDRPDDSRLDETR